MTPLTIGIVGGAGPLAGAALFEKLLRTAQIQFGCWKDADFPKIFLINFPFSEMLSGEVDAAQIRRELNSCLTQLRNNGAEVLAIACNTLHAFLDEDPQISSTFCVSEPIIPLCCARRRLRALASIGSFSPAAT